MDGVLLEMGSWYGTFGLVGHEDVVVGCINFIAGYRAR